jgi:preprotein translocase subunit SecE
VARNIVDEPSEDVVAKARREGAARRGPLGRVALFFRQVWDELKKVVTPTWKELINFTLVVLAFVLIMTAVIYGLDRLFGLLTLFVFGDGPVAG